MNTSKLVQDIDAAASSTNKLNDGERGPLLLAAQKLVSTLESPVEASLRILLSPIAATAVRIGVDMKLFDAVASAGADGATVQWLASIMEAEDLLVWRIARTLAAAGVLRETDYQKFASTPLSNSYVSSSVFSQAIIHLTAAYKGTVDLPDYFEHHGYKSPDDAFNGPFQYTYKTKDHAFEWLAKHEKLQHAFNITMTMARPNESAKWYEYFPVEEKLHTESASDVALVDIGGGVGHDLTAVKTAHPNLEGKFILEDLPAVISSARDLPPGIEAQTHDMFTPQPVKSARAYFLRNVIHDWPDKQASVILGHIRDAMGPDSLLLIAEALMPKDKVPFYNAAADLRMMAASSAIDRTEPQFKKLIEACDFDLVKVWRPKGLKVGNAVVFEARKR